MEQIRKHIKNKAKLLPGLNRPEQDAIAISDIDFAKPWKILGRPRLYNSPAEMQQIITAYFNYCEENQTFPMITGLCLYLDMDRNRLLDYESNKHTSEDSGPYTGIIKKAKMYIHHCLEHRLYSVPNFAPYIFSLKANYKWSDQPDQGDNIPAGIGNLTFIKVENMQVVGAPPGQITIEKKE
ncbi:hypothetical protein LCGC14_0359410 [marine sediment metagenome]|uniref:Uncharacterized protein n=1 Tax=marine sediment metagenome TaxID=412755 RepID=A0A0F9VVQ1_9ZZZZ|nr:hypothetical protein [Candidatus Aminicenantes bacterium]